MNNMDGIQAEDYLYSTVKMIDIAVSEMQDSKTIDIKLEQFAVNNNELCNFISTNGAEVKQETNDNKIIVKNDKKYENEDNNSMEIHQEEVRKMPKKKIKNEANWKVTKRKKAALGGKEHISKSGNNISAKNIQPGCSPCRKKCTEKINEYQRLEIFNNYWNENKSWRLKRQFVLSRVKSTPTERKRRLNGARDDKRKQTIHYDFIVRGKIIDVCKIFFLNTLGISETVVRNVLKKSQIGGFASPDMRGKHSPKNKLPEIMKERIRAHIQSFPVYESQSSHNKTKKCYLASELSIEKMYNLYKIKCQQEGLQDNEISKSWLYRHIFKTEFDFDFKSITRKNSGS